MFLHQVAAGAADRSYGIHVGKLAGLPPAVVSRAEAVLHQLETDKDKTSTLSEDLPLFSIAPMPNENAGTQNPPSPVLAELDALDIDSLAPDKR